MRRIALFLVLLLAGAAWGQGIDGPDTVPPYQLIRLVPNSIYPTEDMTYSWEISPFDRVSSLDSDGEEFVFTAPPGKYEIRLQVIDWENRTFKVFQKAVTIEGRIPPDPDDPDPPPLPPDDPLVMALTEAYKACPESDKRALVQKFAALHREAIPYLNTDKTIGALFNRMERGAKALGLAGRIQPIQEMVAAHLLSLLPDPVATPNAGYDPAKATAAFSQIADALEEVAR